MCGIAGYVNTKAATVTSMSVLARMTEAIQHRGPDDCGFFQDCGVFLGHRRLSIIDLSAGQQPMANEDGTVHIVYNGEIFNHSDVRGEVGARRTRLQNPLRHRNHPPRLRRVRAGLPCAISRHVRVRALGLNQSAGCFARATGSA